MKSNEKESSFLESSCEDGITLELVAFGDYTQVNAALDQGEVDLNTFQHHAYLNKEVEELGYDIVPIAETFIAPLALLSKKIKDINEVKANDKVAIPNDVTNGGRAIKLLEQAKLIPLKKNIDVPSLIDIIDNPLNLEIIEMAAASIPSTLQDVAFATINSGISTDAGLTIAKDAILVENYNLNSGNPYINIIAVNRADEDKELKLQDSKNSTIPV